MREHFFEPQRLAHPPRVADAQFGAESDARGFFRLHGAETPDHPQCPVDRRGTGIAGEFQQVRTDKGSPVLRQEMPGAEEFDGRHPETVGDGDPALPGKRPRVGQLPGGLSVDRVAEIDLSKVRKRRTFLPMDFIWSNSGATERLDATRACG